MLDPDHHPLAVDIANLEAHRLRCVHVRKGEKGSLVVYASSITRTETDASTGEEAERDIPFMKGYTVFNVEQIEGLKRAFIVGLY